jgi:hypothetical protein
MAAGLVWAGQTCFLCLFAPQMLQPLRYQQEQWVDDVSSVASSTDFTNARSNGLYYFTG